MTIIVTVIVPRIVESIGAEGRPASVAHAGADGDGGTSWPTGGGCWFRPSSGACWGSGSMFFAGRAGRGGDSLKLRMPIDRRPTRPPARSRPARPQSRGALIRGGVTITEALRVTRDTVQNTRFREAVDGLMESIHAGESIAKPLQRVWAFPAVARADGARRRIDRPAR